MNSKKLNLNYHNNEMLWGEYLALLKERDFVCGLVDDEQGVPAGVLEEVEYLCDRYETEIQIRKERGDWKEPPWQIPLTPLTDMEHKVLFGCVNPAEFLRSCVWFVNDNLLQKVQYAPPQRPAEEWEAPVWGTIKREAIIELNNGSITPEQAKLLYLFRISSSWEEFDEKLWVFIRQRQFFNNMNARKKTSPRR